MDSNTEIALVANDYSPELLEPILRRRYKGSVDQENLVLELKGALGISGVTARVLLSRGVSSVEEAEAFIRPTLKDGLPNPLTIKDIKQAASIVTSHVRDKKKIGIFSDFDVDGLTSAAQLKHFLHCLGADVMSYTPNRFEEGYGLNVSALKKLSLSGVRLLVTVDCGITSIKEIAFAKKLGMTVVIIDHHVPGKELPDAEAIVDPAQGGCPFEKYELCAAGLVWMLLVAIRAELRDNPLEQKVTVPDPRDFLDLAALGTICDMVPLNRVNRVIASRGLDAIRHSSRPGLAALKECCGIKSTKNISGGMISFGIGPRINAAGRMNDAAEVVELLITANELKAKEIAVRLDKLNSKRKAVEEGMKDKSVAQILASPGLVDRRAVAVYGDDFHLGVIGIVAQRLVEVFSKPAAVMAPSASDLGGRKIKVAKGSVRGVPGFHVAQALEQLSHLLVAHGGHAGAGGFTVEWDKLTEFSDAFMALGDVLLSEEHLRKKISFDLEVRLTELDFSLVEELHKLAPFGVGNPSPAFLLRGVEIASVTPLAGKHLRLRLRDGNCLVNAVAWGFQGHPLLRQGGRINLIFSPEINTHEGLHSLQLDIKEVWVTDE